MNRLIPLQGFSPDNRNYVAQNLCVNVHSSIIHDSYKV